MVEIRKNRSEESLRKKLREGLQNAFVVQSYTSSVEKKGLNKLEFLFCSFKAMMMVDLQLEATPQFRKLLSIGFHCFFRLLLSSFFVVSLIPMFQYCC
ncbi:unnamed protein product [Coffea canephora]|uniref:Uncharacterized protein n=1 Tax=Coffea canephora TaxID=49390 RepID=A0A068UDD5_COFCA|nr:unnamed protein product [Coffea canephora]